MLNVKQHSLFGGDKNLQMFHGFLESSLGHVYFLSHNICGWSEHSVKTAVG